MTPFNLKSLLVIVFYCMNISHGAKILGVFYAPAYSHYVSSSALMKGLARKGHDVTVISPFPEKHQLRNYRNIELTGFIDKFQVDDHNLFEMENANILVLEMLINKYVLDMTEDVLKHKNVQKLLKSNENFDLVIIEDLMDHALKGIAYHFKAPCVMFSAIGLSRLVNSQVGNPYLPSYMADFRLGYTSNMTFFQRLHNSASHNELLQKYFPGAPDVTDLFYNVSLSLVISHVTTQQAVPYVPNMIDVGGIHMEDPKPLSKNLQAYLDNAKDGVIYFSLGSSIRSTHMPKEKRNVILKVFSKLKQRVLWKWEDDELPGIPPNVKIGKWFSQADILGHPNVKLFITHGGLLSMMETVYHGVPVLGIPIYGDQKLNLEFATSNEFGSQVPFSELTAEGFLRAVREILSNSKYGKNAKKQSRIMHDDPIKPLDKAIFWVEYVLRHKGAPHLRTAALSLTWYQLWLLDVALFVAGIAAFIAVVLCFIAKHLWFSNKKIIDQDKKNK